MKSTNIHEIKRKLKKHLIAVNDLKEIFEYLLKQQETHYIARGLIGMIMEYITLLELLKEHAENSIFLEDALLADSLRGMQRFLDTLETKWDTYDRQPREIQQQLENIRIILTKRVKVLTAYQDTAEVYEIMAERLDKKKWMQEQKMKQGDDVQFANEVVHFIFMQKDNLLINEKLRGVLKCLPVRITTQKFLDYVTRSVGKYYGGYVEDLDAFINMCKETFCPAKVEGYGELFPDIAGTLRDVEAHACKDGAHQETVGVKEKVEKVTKDIHHALNVCHYMMSIINKQLAMQYVKKPLADVVKKEPALQFVKNILAFINENDSYRDFELSEKIHHSLVALEGKQEKWLDEIKNYAEAIHFALEDYEEVIKDLELTNSFEEIKKVEMLSSDNLFIDLQKEDKPCEQVQVDNLMINEHAKDFTAFLEKEIKQLPREVRRIKIAQLLALVPPSFEKVEQVHSYILDAMQLCNDPYEKLVVVDGVGEVMHAFGYQAKR